MSNFFNLIKEKELEQKKELKKFIDQKFFDIFNQFPTFIQNNFYNFHKQFLKKENFPAENISSLNKKEYDFYTKRLNNYYSFINIIYFHADLNFLYCDDNIETLFKIHVFSISDEYKLKHLTVVRGLFYLIDKDIFYRYIKKHNLFHIIEELKAIDSVKISNSFTDNKKQFSEEIDLLFNIVNF